jgi:hypothetical protein
MPEKIPEICKKCFTNSKERFIIIHSRTNQIVTVCSGVTRRSITIEMNNNVVENFCPYYIEKKEQK